MKIHPQLILKGKLPIFVILPYKEYTSLLENLEDIKDIEIVKAHKTDTLERFPLKLVESIASGENPIKAFRQYRHLTRAMLAEKANVSRQYIFQIENGEKIGSTRILKAIADVLKVDLEDII